MFSDLKVTIVEGGPDPELWKGMYPPYLYFSSREGKFRSGKSRIKGCVSKGRVVFKKDVLFYFEYNENRESCDVYPIKDGVITEEKLKPKYKVIMMD